MHRFKGLKFGEGKGLWDSKFISVQYLLKIGDCVFEVICWPNFLRLDVNPDFISMIDAAMSQTNLYAPKMSYFVTISS